MIHCSFENTPMVFSMQGNIIDRENRFIPTEVLFDAWKKEIGNKVQCPDGEERVISEVWVDDDYVFIKTVNNNTGGGRRC